MRSRAWRVGISGRLWIFRECGDYREKGFFTMLWPSATMFGYEGRLISAMPTPVSTAVLKAVPLFASVPEEQLRMLTVVVARKSVSRSTTVMAGGDTTDSLYIVLSGRLTVMMSDSEGKEVILAILGPGEF